MGGYIPPAYIWSRIKPSIFSEGRAWGEEVGEGPGPEAIGRAEFPAVAYNQKFHL